MHFCIRTEACKTVDEGFVDDGFVFDALERAKDPDRRCLQYLDPYGNVVFNKAQAHDILQEVARCKAAALSEAEREVMDKLEALASRVSRDVHLYLWVIGQ